MAKTKVTLEMMHWGWQSCPTSPGPLMTLEQSLSTGSGLLYEREITFYSLWDNTFWSLFVMATKAFTLILGEGRETSPPPKQSVQSLSNWRRNWLLEAKTINAHYDSCCYWQYMGAMITMHQLHSAPVFTVPASRLDCVIWNSQLRNTFSLPLKHMTCPKCSVLLNLLKSQS